MITALIALLAMIRKGELSLVDVVRGVLISLAPIALATAYLDGRGGNVVVGATLALSSVCVFGYWVTIVFQVRSHRAKVRRGATAPQFWG